MAKIELDKYYTSREVAKRCIDKTFEIIGRENISEIIEPSAGDGAFSLQIENCIAYDIEPHHKSIKRQDFLDLKMEYQKGRLFIGNPPFGKGNYLAVKFFKHCIKFGDYIAFILPISQLNNNMYMYEFELIHSEDLGQLLYSDRLVHCCFNIYKRPLNGLNKKPNYDLKDVILKTVVRSKGRNDKIPSEYDFSICSFGSIGKIANYDYQYCHQIYFTIIKKEYKDLIEKLIKETDWKKIYKMTTTPTLTHWMINKYLKEQIPQLNYKEK